jgi:hypothetical protein
MVRAIARDDTLFGNESGGLADIYDSRVRLVVHAEAPGGAYAKGRLKLDSKWGDDQEVRTSVDMVYLEVPLWSTVIEAGNDFGWILIGNCNNEPISVISKLAQMEIGSG